MNSSLGRIGAIARTTFIELARLRVFYVLVLFALVLIISSSFLARISFQQELQVTKDIALGAINFFLSMLAIVATAQLLPRDLEDRVIYSVLAKPVRRFEYMLGKFFGVLGLLVISLVAMSILCLAVITRRSRRTRDDAATRPVAFRGTRPRLGWGASSRSQSRPCSSLAPYSDQGCGPGFAHALHFQFRHLKHLYH